MKGKGVESLGGLGTGDWVSVFYIVYVFLITNPQSPDSKKPIVPVDGVECRLQTNANSETAR